MDDPNGYTILVDGYNVIKRHAAWERLALQEGRRRLLEWLGRMRWPISISRVVIVFDGPAADGPAAEDRASFRAVGNLYVRFAAPSADAYIQQAIRTSVSPERLLVISDDGEILWTAKSHGALRYSTQWLFERGRTATVWRDEKPDKDKAALPASTARQITEELARYWLGPPHHPNRP